MRHWRPRREHLWRVDRVWIEDMLIEIQEFRRASRQELELIRGGNHCFMERDVFASNGVDSLDDSHRSAQFN